MKPWTRWFRSTALLGIFYLNIHKCNFKRCVKLLKLIWVLCVYECVHNSREKIHVSCLLLFYCSFLLFIVDFLKFILYIIMKLFRVSADCQSFNVIFNSFTIFLVIPLPFYLNIVFLNDFLLLQKTVISFIFYLNTNCFVIFPLVPEVNHFQK